MVSNHSKYQEYLEHVHGVSDDEESISDKEKIRWLKVVAEQGDLDAQVILADIYCNQKEELKWCKMAAEQGDLLAQNRLGYLYESGRIVERDYSEALIWYRKSREIDESQERISYFYEKIGFIVYSELSNNLSSETSRAFAICTRLITVILRSARSTIPI